MLWFYPMEALGLIKNQNHLQRCKLAKSFMNAKPYSRDNTFTVVRSL
jgi:hypothetical protein